MLIVDFYDQCRVSFSVIGHYFLLASSEYGHIDDLKEVLENHVNSIYSNVTIDWEAINKFMADNQGSYGDNEDWQQLGSNLPIDHFDAMMIAMVASAQNKGSKWLIHSEIEDVRRIVAESGQELEYLINDRNDNVRCAVAEQGYGLDQLVNDISPSVRRAVAKQGYGLDVLMKDSITDIRKTVAEQGYQLNIMMLDKSPHVREAVAKQGYGLDQLEKDASSIVKRGVNAYRKSQKNKLTEQPN